MTAAIVKCQQNNQDLYTYRNSAGFFLFNYQSSVGNRNSVQMYTGVYRCVLPDEAVEQEDCAADDSGSTGLLMLGA